MILILIKIIPLILKLIILVYAFMVFRLCDECTFTKLWDNKHNLFKWKKTDTFKGFNY
jgi:hypothetical protein